MLLVQLTSAQCFVHEALPSAFASFLSCQPREQVNANSDAMYNEKGFKILTNDLSSWPIA